MRYLNTDTKRRSPNDFQKMRKNHLRSRKSPELKPNHEGYVPNHRQRYMMTRADRNTTYEPMAKFNDYFNRIRNRSQSQQNSTRTKARERYFTNDEQEDGRYLYNRKMKDIFTKEETQSTSDTSDVDDHAMYRKSFSGRKQTILHTKASRPASPVRNTPYYSKYLVGHMEEYPGDETFPSLSRSEFRNSYRKIGTKVRCFCEYCMDVVSERPPHCNFFVKNMKSTSRMKSFDSSLSSRSRAYTSRYMVPM